MTMLYNYLKIFHILSAGILLSSMLYSCRVWWQSIDSQRIQTQTWLVIVPIALMQLFTGFTMLSLNQDALLPLYVKGIVIAFVITITSWMLFTYFVVNTQRIIWQKISLFVCFTSILSMIYFMASKL
jgi:hypothetical protein